MARKPKPATPESEALETLSQPDAEAQSASSGASSGDADVTRALDHEGWDITDHVDKEAPSEEQSEEELAATISDDGPELEPDEVPALAQRMEALLFVSARPMSARRLAELLGLTSVVPIRQAAAHLSGAYAGHAFSLRELAGGYQLMTSPECEADVLKLQRQKKAKKLTPGALETLAVIAYKQPITRIEINNIRGVASDHHIRALAERNLVKVVGRKTDGTFGGGAPALYGTTTQFLNEFGLSSLSELPTTDDMVKLQAKEKKKADDGEVDDPNAVAATQAIDIAQAEADQPCHEEEEASANDV